MIKSCLITSKFLNTICNNELLFHKFYENFFLENKRIAKEVIFLLDDNKKNIRDEYKDICKRFKETNIKLGILINDFLLKLNFESINLNEYRQFIDITLDDIKDIEKPIKLEIPYFEFPITENKLKNELKSLTKFATKVTLFDPNFLDHTTNFSQKGINSIKNSLDKIYKGEEFEEFKPKILDIKINNNSNYQACFKTSIRNILDIIVSDKKREGLNLEILTSIKNDTQNKFNSLIKDLIQKYNEENNILIKEKILSLINSIKIHFFSINTHENVIGSNYTNILNKCFSDNKWKKFNINLKIVNDWSKDSDQFYRRGILVEGDMIRTVVCIGKGLNIYELHKKKPTRLRKERNYRLKLIENPNEKKTYTIQTRFSEFEQKIKEFTIN